MRGGADTSGVCGRMTEWKAGNVCQKTFHTLRTHVCFPLLGPSFQAVQEEYLGWGWGNED